MLKWDTNLAKLLLLCIFDKAGILTGELPLDEIQNQGVQYESLIVVELVGLARLHNVQAVYATGP